MNIVFVGLNASYSHTMLSAGYLRAFTERYLSQLSWTTIESTVNDDEGTLALQLAAARPDVLCGTAYLFNHHVLLRVIARVKAMLPVLRVYLGGPQFLGDNEGFLRRYPEVDAVLRGDESSFYRLLQGELDAPGVCRIAADGNYRDQGIARWDGELDALPSPYQHGYFPPGKPFYLLETSRGCPAHCTFCTSAGTGVQYFSLDRVRNDLAVLRRTGARDIRVLDRTFNYGGARPAELLRLFRTEFPELYFHLEINPALVDEPLLAEIRLFAPGKLHLETGVQSLQPEVLRAIRRPATPEKLLSGLERLRQTGVPTLHADLIAGLPEQTWPKLQNDVLTLINARVEEIQLELLKVLPGTALAVQPSAAGLVRNPEPPYEVLSTGTMSADELYQCRILSVLLDSWYPVPQLRPLFAFAARQEHFLSEYMAYLRRHGDPLIKPSPMRRLELLETFAQERGDWKLAELARFVWLWNGLSPEKYQLRVHKYRNETPPAGTPLWQDAGGAADAVRCFTADFSCRAGELLAESSPASITDLAGRYAFYLRHSQKTTAIYAV